MQLPKQEDNAQDAEVSSGGNHVNIHTDDGKIVFLGHLVPNDPVLKTLCEHSKAGTYPHDLRMAMERSTASDWPSGFGVKVRGELH